MPPTEPGAGQMAREGVRVGHPGGSCLVPVPEVTASSPLSPMALGSPPGLSAMQQPRMPPPSGGASSDEHNAKMREVFRLQAVGALSHFVWKHLRPAFFARPSFTVCRSERTVDVGS